MYAARQRMSPSPGTGRLPRAFRSPRRACRSERSYVRVRVCGWARGRGRDGRICACSLGCRRAWLADNFAGWQLQLVSRDAGCPMCVSWLAGGSLVTLLFDIHASDMKICWRAGWRTVAMPPCATSCVRSSGSRGPARARENFRRVCPTRVSNRAPPRAIELVQRRW